MKEEGSSATDSVTDVKDRSQKEEGRRKQEEGTFTYRTSSKSLNGINGVAKNRT
jgi:stress-induced morphogen